MRGFCEVCRRVCGDFVRLGDIVEMLLFYPVLV